MIFSNEVTKERKTFKATQSWFPGQVVKLDVTPNRTDRLKASHPPTAFGTNLKENNKIEKGGNHDMEPPRAFLLGRIQGGMVPGA